MTTEVCQIISPSTDKIVLNDDADNIAGMFLNSENEDVDYLCEENTKTEAERKPFVCDFCGRVFKYNSHFIIHRRCHTGERPFVCNVCNKKFVSNGCLRKHYSVHGEKTFVCNICNCAFKSDGARKKHSAVHSEVKPYKCDVCNKRFRFQAAHFIHKAVHSDARPFVCVVCNSTFKLKSHLLKHNVCHTKEKHFECQICNEKFLYRSTWERHRRVHTGEKPYVCDLCGKEFYQNSALNSHLRAHVQQKKGKDICTKRWPLSFIKDQIPVCMGTGSHYSCEVCGKVFDQRSSFSRHLQAHKDRRKIKVLCIKCNRNWPVSCIEDHIIVCIGSNKVS